MTAISLDDHRGLFRSEADFDFFVSLFKGAAEGAEMTPVLANQRHLVTLLSPANTTSLVQDLMLRRILGNPSILDDIKDRIENDEIVE